MVEIGSMRPKRTEIAAGLIGQAFGSVRADYNAARASRFRKQMTGVSSLGSGADYHYRNETDYYRIVEYARDADRNDQVIGQGVTRLVDNVMQGGIPVDPDTGDPELDKYLVERWGEWCCDEEQCDLAGEKSVDEMAHLVCRQVIVDGDHFVLPNRSGALECVEGHRCKTPSATRQNVFCGVKLDASTRKRLEYWFAADDVNPMQTIKRVSDTVQYAARDKGGAKQVFHVYNPERVTQTRGISAFVRILDTAGQFDDVQFAKLLQQQAASCITFLRERELGFGGGTPAALGDERTEAREGGSRIINDLSPGLEITGEPGESLKGFSPQVPNAGYLEHAMLVLTVIAVNLHVPVAVLLLDPSRTNFSGWRGAMDQARLGFQQIQRWMIRRFYRPVYRWKVRRWIVEDERIGSAHDGLGERLFRHFWSPPSWPYIQPEIEAKADEQIVGALLNSRREVLYRRQLKIEEVDADIVADNSRLIRAAIAESRSIRSDLGDEGEAVDVSWRDLVFLKADTVPGVAGAAAVGMQAGNGPDGRDGRNGPGGAGEDGGAGGDGGTDGEGDETS
jgi:capsid protein